jgi:hypothetical protein
MIRPSKPRRTWTTIASILLGLSFATAAETPVPKWMATRIALQKCYVEEEFRIYYNLEGESALSAEQQADSDADGVPDKVQNIARQLLVARRLFVRVFKFRHPLESPRYRGRVKYFDVHVRDLPKGQNASASDGIVNYRRAGDPEGGYEVLTMDVSRNLSTTNLSPAHEFFHQIQNGYTLFKNAWYTEGTARWSESALRQGTGKAGPLPATPTDKAALFKLRYEADGFWNALAEASDSKGSFTAPRELLEMRYVGSDEPIIQDPRLHGVDFIRALLEELDAIDSEVSQDEGLDPLDWREARQRAVENNEPIWTATLKACRRFQDPSPQMKKFVSTFSIDGTKPMP